jgi:DNA-binding MarR family transcriptional regulator
MSRESGDITFNEYRALADFRYHIRKFQRFSEQAARQVGLEPQQHQLLLAIKGLPDDVRANIGELAERLQIQHHSTVELVDRLALRGLVARKRGAEDRREVVVQLLAKGDKVLRELSLRHREELRSEAAALVQALRKLSLALGAAGKTPAKKPRTRKAD